MTTDTAAIIDSQATLAALGKLVTQAMAAECLDEQNDIISEMHSYLYPYASRPATDAENAALAANEPTAGTVSACPFCGDCDTIPIQEPHGHAMYCTTCFSQGPGASSEAEAAALWNRRS